MLTAFRNSLLRWYMQTPEHPTKYRVVRWLGRSWFPESGVTAPVQPGISLLLHPRDWIEYLLLRGETYEPLTLDFLTRNLERGDAAILAGVNMGLHVVVAAKAVGENGRVIGIEPQPSALLRARANLELNQVSGRVDLVSVALGPADSLIPMAWTREGENAGSASLFDEGESFIVHLTPLSDVIVRLNPNRLKVLLLDVEGFEIEVLKGLRPEHAPDVMIVEVRTSVLERANVQEGDLLGAIRAFGHELFTLHGEPITIEGAADLPEGNVVGVRPGVSVTWVAS